MKYSVSNHHNLWQWGDTSDRVEEMLDAKVVFLWNDFVYADTVRMLQRIGKKVVVFEHGYGALTEHELGGKPTLADGYMTFGQASKDSLIRTGFPEERILVTGNPAYDDVPRKKGKTGKGLYVALHWVHDVAEYNNNIMTWIANCHQGYKWDIKLSNKSGYSGVFPDKWITNVDDPNLFNEIKEKICNYDIIFTPKAGTFDLFAKLAGIPVYVLDKGKSYRHDGDPDIYEPKSNIYMDVQDKIPKYSKPDLTDEILIPSLSLEEILEWAESLK